MRTAVVTGSSGLIGSEMVAFLDERGWRTEGIDNNMRRDFFGHDGDTRPNLEALVRSTRHFTHHDVDVRDRESVGRIVRETTPGLIVHCAAQPSHDLSAQRPLDDFEVNAVSTLKLARGRKGVRPGVTVRLPFRRTRSTATRRPS